VECVTLFGSESALWRGSDAVIRPVENKCPHRGLRLSMGFVRGSRLRCGYHGWQYDETGSCLHMPAHPDCSPPAKINAGPQSVCESNDLIWMRSAETRTNRDARDQLSNMGHFQFSRTTHVNVPHDAVVRLLTNIFVPPYAFVPRTSNWILAEAEVSYRRFDRVSLDAKWKVRDEDGHTKVNVRFRVESS